MNIFSCLSPGCFLERLLFHIEKIIPFNLPVRAAAGHHSDLIIIVSLSWSSSLLSTVDYSSNKTKPNKSLLLYYSTSSSSVYCCSSRSSFGHNSAPFIPPTPKRAQFFHPTAKARKHTLAATSSLLRI